MITAAPNILALVFLALFVLCVYSLIKPLLTPTQRCKEENKSFADPEGGDYYHVFCRDDGSYEMVSDSELMDDIGDEMYR